MYHATSSSCVRFRISARSGTQKAILLDTALMEKRKEKKGDTGQGERLMNPHPEGNSLSDLKSRKPVTYKQESSGRKENMSICEVHSASRPIQRELNTHIYSLGVSVFLLSVFSMYFMTSSVYFVLQPVK